jgi:hypothetical protein
MRYLLSIIFSLFAISLGAQNLSGVVKDTKGNVIVGVSVSIKDSYDGATTDSSGNFTFKTSEKGEQILVATAISYKPFEQKINITGSLSKIEIALKEEITELRAVTISAGSFEASDKKKATVLSSIDMLTTASANADVTGAVKTLPGAQQVGESEGLFVRGGTAAETRTYIDGSLVNNFFYSSVPNVAQRGRFSPWIFKGTVFSTGGYSALYGQALSSALILESIDLPEQKEANLGISVLGLSGGYQHLANNKKSSWGVSYGYTDLTLAFKVIKQKQEFTKIPIYHTADANFRIKTSATGIIKYYGYASANKLAFTENSIDTLGYKDAFGLSNFNIYHNLSYRENIGSGWKLNVGLSFTNNKDEIESNLQKDDENVVVENLEFKNFDLDSRSNYANTKLVLERKLSGLSALRFGTEYNFSNERPVFAAFDGTQYSTSLKHHIKSLFAESDIYLTNNLAAKFGGRLEHSSLLDKVNIAPRISVAYKLGRNSQASLAYGIFYQNPENRYMSSGISDLNFSRASHYIAQYQKVENNRTLRAEIFYKKYHDLIKTGYINGRELAINNKGFGDAKGFDFFWRDKTTIKNLDYWISYSYLDTKRDFTNYPFALRPSFAAKHTTSVVVKKFAGKLKTMFNASYTYASGRPYYNIRYDDNNNKFAIYDEGKTKDYSSMSVSLNYLPNVFKKGASKFTVFVFSVTNVLNTQQVYGYKYSYNGYRKEAIVPPSKMFIFLGAFISFGVDRSQDVINSNL